MIEDLQVEINLRKLTKDALSTGFELPIFSPKFSDSDSCKLKEFVDIFEVFSKFVGTILLENPGGLYLADFICFC